MKTLMAALALVLASQSSAHAFMNEFECENGFAGPRDPLIYVEITRTRGSSTATARVTILPQSGHSHRFEYYSVDLRRSGVMRELNYVASGFNLDINLFPDLRPINLQDYQSSLRLRDFNHGKRFDNLRCRYFQ
jgi:hypothetical protein